MVVSPNDQMFLGNLDHYLAVGRSGVNEISKAWQISDNVEPPRRILDLPSGHGRVTRVLREVYPAAEITACDTNVDGVTFCAEHFNAIPLIGSADIAETPLDSEYDLIWCGSLITHFDEPRISNTVELFARHLAANGILVFTAHGRRAVEWGLTGVIRYFADESTFESMVESYRSTGFAYHPYPGADYGISLTSPKWITHKLESFPELRLLMCHERGWDHHQDVYACQK